MEDNTFEIESIKRLIFKMGWPAALNFSVITLYNLADIVFVGQWLGALPIGAVVIVGVIVSSFSSLGLAIGIGGASIIARSLGAKDAEKAALVFGSQNILILIISLLLMLIGWILERPILELFGANGKILPYAIRYYEILLFGIPFFSWSTMGNSVIHTEGKAKVAMLNNLIPTLLNIMLTPLFIKAFDMGIEGAAWSTLIGYIIGALFVFHFFISDRSIIDINFAANRLSIKVVREIGEIGGSVVANIAAMNLFVVILNQILFIYEQESGVVIFGIINRIGMLFLIPMIGVEGGIRPVIGYSFGAKQVSRIKDTINTAIKYGIVICCTLLVGVWLSADHIVHFFTKDDYIIAKTPYAIRIVFSFFPLFVIPIVANAYFQAIGRPIMSLFLTLFRNVIVLIPLLYIMPFFFGYHGILWTFPIVDVLTASITFYIFQNELKVRLSERVLIR